MHLSQTDGTLVPAEPVVITHVRVKPGDPELYTPQASLFHLLTGKRTNMSYANALVIAQKYPHEFQAIPYAPNNR